MGIESLSAWCAFRGKTELASKQIRYSKYKIGIISSDRKGTTLKHGSILLVYGFEKSAQTNCLSIEYRCANKKYTSEQ